MNVQIKSRRMARPRAVADGKIVSADSSAALELDAHVEDEKRPTKQSLVIDLLQQAEGASLAELVGATGWQAHTTRAALTGLRKKGHVIERFSVDGETRYRIVQAAGE